MAGEAQQGDCVGKLPADLLDGFPESPEPTVPDQTAPRLSDAPQENRETRPQTPEFTWATSIAQEPLQLTPLPLVLQRSWVTLRPGINYNSKHTDNWERIEIKRQRRNIMSLQFRPCNCRLEHLEM